MGAQKAVIIAALLLVAAMLLAAAFRGKFGSLLAVFFIPARVG